MQPALLAGCAPPAPDPAHLAGFFEQHWGMCAICTHHPSPVAQVPSDRYQARALAHLMASRGRRATAVVYEDTAYGYGFAFSFIASFTKGVWAVCLIGPYQLERGWTRWQ